jgi:hypothetical protein
MRSQHGWNACRSRVWVGPLLLGVVWVVAAPFLGRPDMRGYAQGRSRDAAARAQRNSSAIAAVFGDVRAAVSDIVFIKTERYLHSGVAYVPVPTAPDDGEGCPHGHGAHAHAEAGTCGGHPVDAVPDEALLCNGKQKDTLIKSKERDFRSFIGDLHRTVKPWLDSTDAHAAHQSGREILPWFRVMTRSDPHFVRGYAVGGWWLANEDEEAALSFLREGLAGNPEAFQIHQTMALVYRRQAAARADDVAPMRRALELARMGAELACQQRPADWDEQIPSQRWNIYLEDDAFGVARLAVLLARQLHEEEYALRLGRRYLALLGQDDALEGVVAELTRQAHD